MTLQVRERRPDDPRWRAEPLAASTHGRLVAEEEPAGPEEAPGGGTAGAEEATAPDDADGPDGSDALCAAVSRELLGDFAPALLLLPATERSRVRALLTYSRTLFDGAREHGPEGERLAALDRWEAALGEAFAGAAGQPPICRRMARENARRRWPAAALAELHACARRRALRPRPATAAAAESEGRALARAVGGALLEDRLSFEVSGFGGALIRLCTLQRLGEAMARGRCPLPEDEWRAPEASMPRTRRDPEPSAPQPAAAAPELPRVVEQECARLRPRLLRAPRSLVDLPVPYRRVGVFSLLAALRLLSEIEEAGGGLVAAPPHLSPLVRVGLLARARWLGLGPRLR